MANKEFLDELNNAHSMQECYEACVKRSKNPISYDEFYKKVTDRMFKEGLLSDNELDMMSGGNIFSTIGKSLKTAGKAIAKGATFFGESVVEVGKMAYYDVYKPYVKPIAEIAEGFFDIDPEKVIDGSLDFEETLSGKSTKGAKETLHKYFNPIA